MRRLISLVSTLNELSLMERLVGKAESPNTLLSLKLPSLMILGRTNQSFNDGSRLTFDRSRLQSTATNKS